MNRRLHSLSCFFTIAGIALFATDATARTSHKPHVQKTREAGKKPHAAKEVRSQRQAKPGKSQHAKHAAAQRKAKQAKPAPAPKEATPPLTGDLALVKDAIDLARKAKTQEATDIRNRIADPAAQKLVEWYILRHPDTIAPFSRYAAFIAANPEWPSAALLRRRAEARLWEQRSDAAKVRGFTGDQPISARGKLALARILLGEGDADGAGRLVRDAWQTEELSERVEAEVMEMFRDLLTREDHRARMDRRLGAKDGAGAMRAAKLLGGEAPAIVKACAAV